MKNVAVVGFGEAGQAFASGWQKHNSAITVHAFDIKTDSDDQAALKKQDYRIHSVIGCDNNSDATANAGVIFSLVTAEQALNAARSTAQSINKAYYFDCNSCAPETKRAAAQEIAKAGGRYVDVAVMGPVGPVLEKIPLLISGEHAQKAIGHLQQLGMNAKILPGDVGRASSVKMIRSIMMKGLEALALECLLSARTAGVEDEVLQSLERTYPGFGWNENTAHMLERAMTHGIRRAEEMREVVKTVNDLGLPNPMAKAIVDWQQRVGELQLSASGEDVRQHADQLLDQLNDKP